MKADKSVSFTAGHSVRGRDILAYRFGVDCETRCSRILVLGAVHGDEPEGPWLLGELIPEWNAGWPYPNLEVIVVPEVNPDGFHARLRVNANAVDLNRNMPTRDWQPHYQDPDNNPGPAPGSEPETQAVLSLLKSHSPHAILTIHSMKAYQINCNGPALDWCQALARVSGYPVTQDIGYPCPGSLGTYAGAERQIPTITLEVERGLSRTEVLEKHLVTVRCALEYWNNSPSAA